MTERFAIACLVLLLAASSPVLAPAHAADPTEGGCASPAEAGERGGADLETLREQFRKLGDMIRDALDSATDDLDWGAAETSGGGLGGLAPRVTERNLRSVYGPDGPTVRSVSALLAYRLILLGNPRLEAGKVYEEEDAIIAEVVTKKEQALVARYRVNKKTGVWAPQR